MSYFRFEDSSIKSNIEAERCFDRQLTDGFDRNILYLESVERRFEIKSIFDSEGRNKQKSTKIGPGDTFAF